MMAKILIAIKIKMARERCWCWHILDPSTLNPIKSGDMRFPFRGGEYLPAYQGGVR